MQVSNSELRRWTATAFPRATPCTRFASRSLAVAHVPELAPLLVPFTLLVGASRVVLGLHYPSDVVAGAVIGATLAGASLAVWPA